ncbi:MAG: hypothetical protein AUH72_17955 [Acidobacteria bacterium 13_1_40CM_4_65_8]|nr:MAG: hypothetical protein AUH72_17955 [Acidobacteria bacterium 13_1_40CM_4_65_8]
MRLCAVILVALVTTVNRSPFGRMPEGTAVELLTLRNDHGIEIKVITYGASITSVKTPDRNGRFADIVLGFDDLDSYLTRSRFFGAVAGRYANRIARGQFTIDGKTFQLATNNGANHLHGGVKGFDKVVWNAEPFERNDSAGVVLRYTSRDGEEGYPGTLNASVTYTLTPRDELVVEYGATTDKATHVNLTQHSYFNLAGEGNGDVLRHQMMISADRYTPVDEGLIPTGELAPVEGSPFDFRKPAAIGARIDADHEQIRRGAGYDHNFVLTGGGGLHDARSSSRRRSQAASSTRATACREGQGKAVTCTICEAVSASRRSTSPTRRTNRASRRHCSGPARRTRRRPCSRLGSRDDHPEVAGDRVSRGSRRHRGGDRAARRRQLRQQLRRREPRSAERQRRVVVVHGSARHHQRRQADCRIGARGRQQSGEHQRSAVGQRGNLRLRPRER